MMALAVTRHEKVIPVVTRIEALSVEVRMIDNGVGRYPTQEGHPGDRQATVSLC
jgi:hypothetical protein